jgi:transposase
LTSKVSLLCETQRARPLGVALAPGNRLDYQIVQETLDAVRVPRSGSGRPRKRSIRVLADKGYSYAEGRRALRGRGIATMIPERRDQRARRQKRGHKGGRPCRFDKAQYARRNSVERCFLRLKQQRRVATRYDKLKPVYQAWLSLASIRMWLN